MRGKAHILLLALAMTMPAAHARDCLIKGNINSHGERIYHMPGSKWYARTKISPSRGERWFCTEEEAIRAGWRPPLDQPWSRTAQRLMGQGGAANVNAAAMHGLMRTAARKSRSGGRRGLSGGRASPSSGCLIKGNINRRGECIYHVPGSRWYARTKITPSRGERWFCSVQEAEAAGCRAPRR